MGLSSGRTRGEEAPARKGPDARHGTARRDFYQERVSRCDDASSHVALTAAKLRLRRPRSRPLARLLRSPLAIFSRGVINCTRRASASHSAPDIRAVTRLSKRQALARSAVASFR
jgi:hypothetical protein